MFARYVSYSKLAQSSIVKFHTTIQHDPLKLRNHLQESTIMGVVHDNYMESYLLLL